MPVPRFDTIRTGRWTIRPLRPDDAEPLWRRRNDPETARFQSWTSPYPEQAATELVAQVVALDGVPPDNGWFQLAIDDSAAGEPVGDVAIHMTFDGRCAEIGYTVAAHARGRHIATDAAARVARWLFDAVHVTRVGAQMHPDNHASARVAESIGMVHEGRTLKSFWVGRENSDDTLYGMTHEQWAVWTDRDRHRPDTVRLVDIHADHLDEVLALRTHHTQERLVDPVPNWFGSVFAPGDRQPWVAAIEADGAIVGALLMARPDDDGTAVLWRLMVDRMHQGRGIGDATLDLTVELARRWQATSLSLRWRDLPGNAGAWFEASGFTRTGEVDGEIVARLEL